ncbi:MAG: protoheme IX farnesyltransferase [Flammeovirgaceae bacterium]|nr:protoheme IX farnesyltransferase [Flammeovirgaceae bacterium]|tara:strand:+ start:4379 stop:5269 length:891 start_codon:yes stop_codon:yes gene_type:complete
MNNIEIGNVGYLTNKLISYYELLKPRLSFLVSFSAAFGFLLGAEGTPDLFLLMMLGLGSFLISGAAVTINQIIERNLDALMKRTSGRPIPTSKINHIEASIYSFLLFIIGIIIVAYYTNFYAAVLAIFSLMIYAFAYTPLKRIGPIAVFVGAIPGALPPLIGWVAATGVLTYEAWIIFGIQFIWQFPHFWAIAWVSDDDYKKAGFKLLPGDGKKDLNTAINIMIYTLFLLPLGLLPTYFGLTGLNSGIIATCFGVLFLAQTFQLMKDNSHKSALRIMFGSFIYLPIVQISYLFDKL